LPFLLGMSFLVSQTVNSKSVKAITETLIGLFDLAESEGKLFQKKFISTAVIIIVAWVAALLFVVAMIFFMAGAYYFLIEQLPLYQVYLIMGGICFFVMGMMIWIAVRMNR